MDDISELEQRLTAALTTIGDVSLAVETQSGAQDDALDRLNADVTQRDKKLAGLTENLDQISLDMAAVTEKEQAAQDQIGELSSQVEALQDKLAAGEASLKEAEGRRENDLAELDEILDQLEPLFEGSK